MGQGRGTHQPTHPGPGCTKLGMKRPLGVLGCPVYGAHGMNADSLDIRLLRFRSRRDEPPHALALSLMEASRFGEALEVLQVGLNDSEDDPRLLVLAGRAWF